MNSSPSQPPDLSQRTLRLWPGVVAVTIQWLIWLVVPRIFPDGGAAGVLGGLAGGLVVLVWWLFFSRAPWPERLLAPVLMVAAVFITFRVVHPSIANGMMGMMLIIYSVPVLSLALVVWATMSRGFPRGRRRLALVVAVLLGCGGLTLVRTGGITGGADADLHWRWSPTPEERMLSENGRELPKVPPTSTAAADPQHTTSLASPSGLPTASLVAAWPGFRGAHRDDLVHGTHVATNWSRATPIELWRHPIGPGWSTFAVEGSLIYTQEQRGEEEIVSCYQLATGAPAWRHADTARFWESNAGAGPRGTPTVSNGRVYTLGGTGILNALVATNGTVLWTRNAAHDTGAKLPEWGFASSPLVLGELVLVATAGVLAAYELQTGAPLWTGPKGGWGYSSPHLAVIDGVQQIVLLNGLGAIGVEPSDGKVLWTYSWKSDGIVQPSILAGGDLLIGSGSGIGTGVGLHRIGIKRGPEQWGVEERWRSIGLKPYFGDFVVHQGHAYGFDGSMLACVDLADGKRRWKGGRYGYGQLIGLSDQDLLLVLSERGEIALVRASPDDFVELARFPAIEGKTWNHPVVAGDVLLVRNDHEMAAFRLPTRGSPGAGEDKSTP